MAVRQASADATRYPRAADDRGRALRRLADCLAPACVGQEVDIAHELADADPDPFLRLVWRHRLPGLAWQAIMPYAGKLPGALCAGLRDMAGLNARHALAHAAELARIHEHADRAGLPVLALKGPPLSRQAYGDSTLRHSRDIDILVDPRHFPAVEDLLTSAGYRRESPSYPRSDRRWKTYRRFTHHVEYRREGWPLPVELHWRLHPVASLFPVSCRELLRRAVHVDIGAATVPTMAPADQLLYLCSHGARHNWQRLKWLCDLPPLMARFADDDVAALNERTVDCGLQRPLAQGLRLCREFWPGALPSWAVPLADERSRAVAVLVGHAQRALLAQSPDAVNPRLSMRENLANIRAFLLLKPSLRYKAARLRNLPFELEFLEHSPWAGRHPGLYLLTRPFQWLKRRLLWLLRA